MPPAPCVFLIGRVDSLWHTLLGSSFSRCAENQLEHLRHPLPPPPVPVSTCRKSNPGACSGSCDSAQLFGWTGGGSFSFVPISATPHSVAELRPLHPRVWPPSSLLGSAICSPVCVAVQDDFGVRSPPALLAQPVKPGSGSLRADPGGWGLTFPRGLLYPLLASLQRNPCRWGRMGRKRWEGGIEWNSTPCRIKADPARSRNNATEPLSCWVSPLYVGVKQLGSY